ncbi:GFA family protein [Novosphingobium profundi]|uniref:GFA family protein n=1 Tax=Novosphingobium profundi TaxID=1774954 RepID=UPI001CFDB61B|nr:GFA family protein [Novosphingobium profundi]
MSAPYHGACNCGAVTLTIASEPLWVRQCWCRQCQKAAAGNATCNGLFRTEGMTVSGDVTWRGYEAASGNTVEQGFCAACGTPVFARNSSRGGAQVVRLGVLDDAADLSINAIIWTSDAPDWAYFDPQVKQWPGQPPVAKPAT